MTPTETESAPGLPFPKRLRHRIEYLALRGFRAVVRCLPLSAVRALAGLLGSLAARFDRRGRATALANLTAVFGATLTPAARSRMVAESYRHFARVFFELFWVGNLRPELSAKWCPMVFEDEAATVAAAREGAIFITPHYGSFEWLAVAWCHRGHPLVIIAQDSKNPLVTPLIVADRSRCGNEIIRQQGALLKLLRALKSGRQVALLPDLTTPPKGNAAIIRMFGMKTSVTSLPAALATRTGCAIIPAISIPLPDGRYQCHFSKPIRLEPGTSQAAAAQACWDVFEPIIRRQPAPWLWMYKHWRYLPADARPADYPAYANRSKDFDRLDNASQS